MTSRAWALLAPLAAVLVCAPLLLGPGDLVHADSYRAYDWFEAAKYAGYARQTLVEEGRPALWNPLLQGGMPSYAHPTDGSLSPFFVLPALLGVLRGMQLNVVLLLALGALCVYGLAREWLALDRGAAAFAGGAFAVSGWAPSRVAVGFYESLFLLVVPIVMLLLWRAWQTTNPMQAAGHALVAAALLAAAGVQMQLCLPFALVVITVWALLAHEAPSPTRLGRRLAFMVAFAVVVAGLGAFKFVPMLELLTLRGWRAVPLEETAPAFEALLRAWGTLFATAPAIGSYDPGGWPLEAEYAFGGLPIVVGLLALLAAARGRRGRALLLLLAVTSLLSWQPARGPQVSLFPLLRLLPPFGSMRDTGRYVTFFLVLWSCLSGGVGFAWVIDAARRHGRSALLVGAALALALLPSGLRSAALFGDTFDGDLPARSTSAELYHVALEGTPAAGIRSVALFQVVGPRSGVGVLAYEEDLPGAAPSPVVPRVRLHPDGRRVPESGWRGEAWLAEGDGAARLELGAPNELVVHLRSDGPALVVLNQNAWPGWRTRADVEVTSDRGLLAVRTRAPVHGSVVLEFRPPILRIGVLTTLSTVLAVVLGWVGLLLIRERRAAR